MSLQLDLTKEQLWQCKLLAKGQTEFDELDFETQLLVYESNVNISDVVDEEALRDFEDTLAMKGYFGVSELARAAARQTRQRIA